MHCGAGREMISAGGVRVTVFYILLAELQYVLSFGTDLRKVLAYLGLLLLLIAVKKMNRNTWEESRSIDYDIKIILS